MTTIYLTNFQYQQILDGMITTHLDVLDNNGDGMINQLGDLFIGFEHGSGHGCDTEYSYHYAYTDLIDKDDSGDIVSDMLNIGLAGNNEMATGFSDADIEFEGDLYAYDLEKLNKIIDFYNNGGSWNDDDFDSIVYEGVGALGKKAPDGMFTAGSAVENQFLSGQNKQKEFMLADLKASGATDIKYTSDGMIASYTIDGVTYSISQDMYGDFFDAVDFDTEFDNIFEDDFDEFDEFDDE